jgi:2-oxo-4-hydroxy-4-carboxy-5-ureidoimidazoline decarboxylase
MAEAKPKVGLDYLNTTDRAGFERSIGGLFEKNAWVAARTFNKRPFTSLDDLYTAMTEVIFQASPAEKLELIQSHPELVGREAVSGTLSSQSQQEQARAGLTNLSPAEVARFNDYNRAYRAQFGFPFIICARKHHKSTILAAFPVRMQHSQAEEIEIALAEICQILEFRLRDAVGNNG